MTQYKRTLVEEYAPYVCEDGLIQKITRFTDFACTDLETMEEIFENRHDKLTRVVLDARTNLVTEYFAEGREDSMISTNCRPKRATLTPEQIPSEHVYYKNSDNPASERTIFLNSKARFDGLAKIEMKTNICIEHYIDRDDK